MIKWQKNGIGRGANRRAYRTRLNNGQYDLLITYGDGGSRNVGKFDSRGAATTEAERLETENAEKDAERERHGDLSRAEITENRGAMMESTMKSKKKMQNSLGRRGNTLDLRQLGADHAQEQLDSDYFRDWVREQLFEGEQMRRRDPSSVIPFDANVIAKNMLQQLVWDTKRNLRISEVVGRGVSGEEADEFMEGFEEHATSKNAREWLAEEILEQTEQGVIGGEIYRLTKYEYDLLQGLERVSTSRLQFTADELPTVDKLVKLGFLIEHKDGRRIQYTISDSGKQAVLGKHPPYNRTEERSVGEMSEDTGIVRSVASVRKRRAAWQPGGTSIAMESIPISEVRKSVLAAYNRMSHYETKMYSGEQLLSAVKLNLDARTDTAINSMNGLARASLIAALDKAQREREMQIQRGPRGMHEEWQPGGTSIAMEDRSHLPRSQMSLEDYEREVLKRLRYIGVPNLTTRSTLIGEEARMLVLNGWRQGRKPFTTATEIERAWRESSHHPLQPEKQWRHRR